MTLKYVPETKIGKISGLSNQKLIKKQWIYNLVKVIIEGLEVNIVEKIKRARSKDKEVVKIVEKIKKVRVKVLREDKWQIEEKLVLKEEKVCVPKNKELRAELI